MATRATNDTRKLAVNRKYLVTIEFCYSNARKIQPPSALCAIPQFLFHKTHFFSSNVQINHLVSQLRTPRNFLLHLPPLSRQQIKRATSKYESTLIM